MTWVAAEQMIFQEDQKGRSREAQPRREIQKWGGQSPRERSRNPSVGRALMEGREEKLRSGEKRDALREGW